MILSKLKKNKCETGKIRNGTIIVTQSCDVKCDTCGKIYRRKYYNVISGYRQYNKDLCRGCKQEIAYTLGLRTSCIQIWSRKQSGKTLEQILGVEKAKLVKEKFSKNSSGKNNPNYGGKYCKFEKCHEDAKGKTWEQRFGIDKANKIKHKLSISSSGENNPMFGKPSPKKSGNGWKGRFNGIYFRSILELKYMMFLTESQIQFNKAEIIKYRIDYIDPISGNKRTYSPDFYLPKTDQIAEVKPEKLINTTYNKAKFNAAKERFGKRFIIIIEKDIPNYSSAVIKEYIDKGLIIFDKIYLQKFKEYSNVS